MIADELIDTLKPQQLRQALRAAQAEAAAKNELIARQAREVAFKQATIDKLTHEMAVLKRLKFAAKSEAFTPEQKSLIEETLDTDLAALAAEIEAQQPARPERQDKQSPKRAPLPADLPRREIHHEPEDTTCSCGQAMKRIGQDVAEKLDYAARRVHRRAARARQVGLHLLPDPGAGPGAAARHRQGHPHRRPAGPGAGGQVPGSPAAVPAGSHLRARRPRHRPLDPGAVGGRMRRAAAAAGGRAGRRDAQAARAARRRDAGGDAQARAPAGRQDAPGLPVELLHHAASTR